MYLIYAVELLDRGTWMRQSGNNEPFTAENIAKQVSESPLNYLEPLSSFQELKRKCKTIDLSKKIDAWNAEFAKRVFEGKKERFWSHVADDYLANYVSEVSGTIRLPLMEQKPFLVIGGSHTIGWPISKAIFEHYKTAQDKISVIFFDEHEDDYAKGVQKIRPTMYHGSWAEVVRRNYGYSPFHINPENFNLEKLQAELKGKKYLYLSVDADVFNAEHVPSTFYSHDKAFSVGTMTYEIWKKYLAEIQKICRENSIKILGADLCEFIPYGHTEDENKKTAGHCAKLLGDLHNLLEFK